MIFRLIDSRIIAAISPEVRSRQHIRDPAAAISAIDHRPIDKKAGRLPIAAIAENVINAHGFADRERRV
jgi:hypothetical protein